MTSSSLSTIMNNSLIIDLQRIQLPENEIHEASEFLKISMIKITKKQHSKLEQNQAAMIAETIKNLAIKRMFKKGCPKNVIIEIHEQKDSSWVDLAGKAFIGGIAAIGGGIFVTAYPAIASTAAISFVGYKAFSINARILL